MPKKAHLTFSAQLEPDTYDALYDDYRKAKLQNNNLTWDIWFRKKLGIYVDLY